MRQLAWPPGNAILFAGRTDAGVHASGQMIAFDLDWNHSEDDLCRALNSILPQDVSIKGVEQTGADFHPRFHALARRYQYRIYCCTPRDPLKDRYAWRVWPPLDFERLQIGSKELVGIHDFAAFGSPHKPSGSTIREIMQASWKLEDNDYFFEVLGNAFLYHMVRHIVELLVVIGQGREHIDAVRQYLQDPAGSPVQGLAPAQGLILKEVLYDK